MEHEVRITHDEDVTVDVRQAHALAPYFPVPHSWLPWLASMSEGQMITALALLSYADPQGRCWPSTATISKKACVAESTVRAALNYLAACGLIARFQRPGQLTQYLIQHPTRRPAEKRYGHPPPRRHDCTPPRRHDGTLPRCQDGDPPRRHDDRKPDVTTATNYLVTELQKETTSVRAREEEQNQTPTGVFSRFAARPAAAPPAAAPPNPSLDALTPEERDAVKAVALALMPDDLRGLMDGFEPLHPALRPVLERYMRDGTL
jgi:hypothetical protein